MKQITVECMDAQTLIDEFAKIKAMIAEINSRLVPVESVKYITRGETAALLKVSLPTLNDWTKKEILKAYRIGKMLRYKEDEVLVAPIPTRSNSYYKWKK